MEENGILDQSPLSLNFSNVWRLAGCQRVTYVGYTRQDFFYASSPARLLLRARQQGSFMQAPHKHANVVRFDRNRRSAARYKLQLPVIFHWNEGGDRTGGGFTSDVALDGALINSSMCPPVGSDVQIEVLILSPVWGGVEMRIQCAGKVTRVMDQGDMMSFGVRGDFDDDHLTPSFRGAS